MKKLLVLVVFAGGLVAISSCKKDWTCSCDITTTGTINSSTSADTVFSDMTKSDAKSECNDLDGSFTAFGQSVTTECELK